MNNNKKKFTNHWVLLRWGVLFGEQGSLFLRFSPNQKRRLGDKWLRIRSGEEFRKFQAEGLIPKEATIYSFSDNPIKHPRK